MIAQRLIWRLLIFCFTSLVAPTCLTQMRTPFMGVKPLGKIRAMPMHLTNNGVKLTPKHVEIYSPALLRCTNYREIVTLPRDRGRLRVVLRPIKHRG